MSLNDEVAVLAQVPLFANISNARLKLIAFASQRVEFTAGQDICRQGEPGDCAYIILSGHADVFVHTDQGERKISTVETHQIMGEIAVLADVPRSATVRASREVVALRLTKDVLVNVMQDFPDIAIEITRIIAWRLHNTIGQFQTTGPE